MTQVQDPTPEQTPAPQPVAHSRWKYIGVALGTLFIEGRPLATVTAVGEIVEASDEETATLFEQTGLFEPAPADAPAPPLVSDEPVQIEVPADVFPTPATEAEAEAESTPQERE